MIWLERQFYAFNSASVMFSKRRHRSCPPCVEHEAESVVSLPCGVTCMTRCHTRESYYKECQINEDREYLWALIERARRLPPLSAVALENKEAYIPTGIDLASDEQKLSVWTCACGTLSVQSALFCWNCGVAKAAKQPLHVGVPTKHCGFESISKQVYVNHNPSMDMRNQDKLKASLESPPGNAISQSSLDALGCAMTKYGPSPGSGGADESTVSNMGSFKFGSGATSGTSGSEKHCGSVSANGSDDKDVSASEGGRSNSGEESSDRPTQDITTLMICSIPFQVSREELLQAMDSLGFAGTYDFLYMPSRSAAKKHGKTRRGNVGYAFVNFRYARFAARFTSVFAGFTFPGSDKQVFVRPAVCQGLVANLGDDKFKRKNQNDIMLFPLQEHRFQ